MYVILCSINYEYSHQVSGSYNQLFVCGLEVHMGWRDRQTARRRGQCIMVSLLSWVTITSCLLSDKKAAAAKFLHPKW